MEVNSNRQPHTVYRMPSASMSRGLRTSGFTLFELMVVMVIIGLMSAMVVPKVGRNLNTLKLKAETKKVAAVLRYARSRAVSENMTLSVKFNMQDGVVTVAPDRDAADISSPWRQFSDEEESKVLSQQLALADGIDIFFTDDDSQATAETMEIVFYPSGGSTGGNVVLKIGEKRQYCLVVDEISGTVKVLEDYEEALG